ARRRRRVRPRRPRKRPHPARRASQQPGRGRRRAGPLPRRPRRGAATQAASQVSVKLTHLGLDVDRGACEQAVDALAARAEDSGSFLWIDMEESRYVDVTLEVFRAARGEHTNVGVCLQAYLRRTPQDLARLLALGPAIRLVKGAYNEPAH